MEVLRFHWTALLIGCLFDWLLGDPRWLPHPVCMMGRMIQRLEQWLRREEGRSGAAAGGPSGETAGERRRLLAGGAVLTAVMCVFWTAATAAVFALLAWAAGSWGRWLLLLAEAFFCGQLLAARSLFGESMKVCRFLEAGDTEGARRAVSMIVGRDTKRLDQAGIIRAAVETVAENTSDGVVAPFLFMAVFGPAGGAFYKAVNTMDSMIGYRNARYQYFGRAAARLDDLVNLLPARLTGCLITAAAWLLPGYDGPAAWRIFCRDRKRHASPNSAHGEAACAGALHVRLAGDAWYFGELHKKPFLGDDLRPVETEDIPRAGRLMLGAEGLLMAALLALLAASWARACG